MAESSEVKQRPNDKTWKPKASFFKKMLDFKESISRFAAGAANTYCLRNSELFYLGIDM